MTVASAPEPTKDQQDAIHIHDQNLIVVAGAGSGKTFVLVQRYLTLLEANPDWPLTALVAITFTQKAAREMRDRVRRELEKRYTDAPTAEERVRWAAQIAQIDSARIDTIHGLCASLLRANAARLGIDPDFAVLDETEAAILLEDTVDAVLVSLVQANHPCVELLVEYEPQKVRACLNQPALINADLPMLPDDLFALWHQQWLANAAVHIRGFIHHVQQIGIELSLPPGDKLSDRWIAFKSLYAGLSGDEIALSVDLLEQISNLNVGNVGSKDAWGSKEAVVTSRKALMAIRAAAKATFEKHIGGHMGALDEKAARMIPLWDSAIRHVRADYAAAKHRQRALDFDDLETMTRNLLINRPDVVKRYRGAEFKHLLVDEFQDTNAAQWAIVKALAGLDVPGSMFVVGDQKQSIYAFRGADVSVFGGVKAEITDNAGREIQMAQSFRTHQPLVNAFNFIFERLLTRDPQSPIAPYQVTLDKHMASKRPPPAGDLPPIEFLLIDKFEYTENAEKINDKGIDADTQREWEALELAYCIQQMVADGRVIYDKSARIERPLEYGDIAVLFQALSNVNVYEDAFKSLAIPFITVAGRGYYDRQEVWDLRCLLQVVVNPADNLSLAVALRSPLFGLSDDALFALRLQTNPAPAEAARPGPMSLWQALAAPGDLVPDAELPQVHFAHATLNHLRSIAGRVTISELLQDALERTGYLAILTGLPDGTRRRGNVLKLLEKAQSSGSVTLEAFTQTLRDLTAREAREGEAAVDTAGAVQIMSIHASKGLEFPVVVLADAAWQRGNQSDLLLFEPGQGLACKVYDPETDKMVPPLIYRQLTELNKGREAAERLRLLYVAATRAQDYLMISGRLSNTNKDGLKGEGWLASLLDALDLTDILTPCMDQLETYAWGSLRVTIPPRKPQMEGVHEEDDHTGYWDHPVPAMPARLPPLLQEVVIRRIAQARHLAATQLTQLGNVEHARSHQERRFYSEQFRRQVLQDAPNQVREIITQRRKASPRQIGDIVHEALRYWQLPGLLDNDALHELLRSYAWRLGITDEVECVAAATAAFRLLEEFKQSDIFYWIDTAKAVYRELPFVYERDGFIIYGVIDALFQTSEGRWVIVDYKTGMISSQRDKMIAHARRYHLQLGIYADAVQAQLGGDAPQTYVHFLRHAVSPVQIHEHEWRAALDKKLSGRIMELIEDKSL